MTNSNPPTNSINEILEGEVLKMIGMWLKQGEWDEQPHKIVRKTAQAQKTALYTLIADRMPKLKNVDIEIPDTLHRNTGYNQALIEVKDIIEEIFNV